MMGSPLPDLIREEAARWFARNEAREGAEPDAAFSDWLARDMRHRLAYAEIERNWRDSLALAGSPLGQRRALRRAPFLMRRSTHLAGLALASVCIVGLVSIRFIDSRPILGIGVQVEARTFDTLPGQSRTWHLPDGSTLTLSGASHATSNLEPALRRFEIGSGTARLIIDGGDPRPAEIRAGALVAHTNAATLDVTAGPRVARIRIIDGAAVGEGPADRRQELAPGDQITFQPVGAAPAATPQREPSSHMLPADNLTLGRAVELLNAANATKIRLADPLLAKARLAGAFRSDDPEGFARIVANVLGLEVAYEKGGSIILSPRS